MTTTTGTPVTCPPSAVHDMIVRWDEVCDGDLVLWHGEVSRWWRMDECAEARTGEPITREHANA